MNGASRHEGFQGLVVLLGTFCSRAALGTSFCSTTRSVMRLAFDMIGKMSTRLGIMNIVMENMVSTRSPWLNFEGCITLGLSLVFSGLLYLRIRPVV